MDIVVRRANGKRGGKSGKDLPISDFFWL